jgi:hypothetical protein
MLASFATPKDGLPCFSQSPGLLAKIVYSRHLVIAILSLEGKGPFHRAFSSPGEHGKMEIDCEGLAFILALTHSVWKARNWGVVRITDLY